MSRRYLLLLLAVLFASVTALICHRTRERVIPEVTGSNPKSASGSRVSIVLPPTLAPRGIVSESSEMGFSGSLVSRLDGGVVERGELTFSGNGQVYSVVSAADGTFHFHPPHVGIYQLVTVSAEGFLPFAPMWGDSPMVFTARLGVGIAGVVIQLAPTKSITVKVTDSSGAPIPAAAVSVALPMAMNSGVIPLAAPVKTDVQGIAKLSASVGGIVRAELDRSRSAQQQLSPDAWMRGEISLRFNAADPDDPGNPTLAITGTVVGENRAAVPEVVVSARISGASPFAADDGWSSASSGPDGQFSITGLAPGGYTLTASAPGLVSARVEGIAAGSTGVTLQLGDPGGWISGQVLADASSKPVASFVVILSQAVGKLEERPVETRSFFDAQGDFSVGPFAPGSYILRVAAHDFAAPKARSIAVTAGNTTRAEVRLVGGGVLQGRVLDGANGRGIAGARVLLEGSTIGDSLPLALEKSATAALDGRFSMAGIPAGQRSVSASAVGYNSRIVSGIRIEDGGTAGPIELALTPVLAGTDVKVEITGIGAALAAQQDVLVVGKVLEGGGAAAAGILVGDEILAIDGVSVGTMDFNAAMQRIRGPVGTTVIVAVRRDRRDRDVTVTRRLVQAPATPSP